MRIEILPLTTRKDFKDFIKLPWKIYQDDPHWVPPLIADMKRQFNRDKHPFFQHSEAEFFLAKRHGEVVGRIAAILNNNHNAYHNERTGFFGFFECMNDAEAAQELLECAQTWLKERDMITMRGPTNYSTNETCGFLVEGFGSPPVVLMPYNPQYYLELMEDFGLKRVKYLYAYYFDRDMPMPERFVQFAEKTLADKSINLRTLNLKDLWNEVKRVKAVYDDAWSDNWGFVPMTDAELAHMAAELKPVVDPDIVYFADVDGDIAGFSLSLPDFNVILKEINGRLFPFGIFKALWMRKKIRRIRVITLGVRHKYQNKRGLAPAFYYETYRRGKAKGYALAEFSWILEDNVLMNRALQGLGAKLYKRYVMYEKAI